MRVNPDHSRSRSNRALTVADSPLLLPTAARLLGALAPSRGHSSSLTEHRLARVLIALCAVTIGFGIGGVVVVSTDAGFSLLHEAALLPIYLFATLEAVAPLMGTIAACLVLRRRSRRQHAGSRCGAALTRPLLLLHPSSLTPPPNFSRRGPSSGASSAW